MPQSLAQIYLHLVFSTKERFPFLKDKSLREEIHRYLGGACNGLDCPVIQVGGIADHVHVLCRLGRTMSAANLIQELKRDSSKWIKTKADSLRAFHWQAGYGAFSISPSHVDELTKFTWGSARSSKPDRTEPQALQSNAVGVRSNRLQLSDAVYLLSFATGTATFM